MNSFLELINKIRGSIGNSQAQATAPAPLQVNTETPERFQDLYKQKPIGRGWDVSPTPQVDPNKPYRSPIWDTRRVEDPVKYGEYVSGTKLASDATGVPQPILMDIPAIESTGAKYEQQFGGGPGRGGYMFEQYDDFDPLSATQSALKAAQEIKAGRLSRWGTPEGTWGSLNNPNNSNGKLTDLYTFEELNQYLAPNRQLQ